MYGDDFFSYMRILAEKVHLTLPNISKPLRAKAAVSVSAVKLRPKVQTQQLINNLQNSQQ